MLLTILEEYNIKLLSTKIYWERPKEREEYKKFWEDYKKIDLLKTEQKKNEKREILFIKHDLEEISQEPEKYKLVIAFYKDKLVELGAIKKVKDTCKTKEGKNTKKEAKAKKEKAEKETKTKTVKRKTTKKTESTKKEKK